MRVIDVGDPIEDNDEIIPVNQWSSIAVKRVKEHSPINEVLVSVHGLPCLNSFLVPDRIGKYPLLHLEEKYGCGEFGEASEFTNTIDAQKESYFYTDNAMQLIIQDTPNYESTLTNMAYLVTMNRTLIHQELERCTTIDMTEVM